MTNKIGIGIEAQLDTAKVEQELNAFGRRVAQANKVQFNPVSIKSVEDLKRLTKASEEYMKVADALRRKAKGTNQSGRMVHEMDFESMFPNATARQAQMLKAAQRLMGSGAFSAPPSLPTSGGGGGGAAPPGSGGGSSLGGAAANVVQAGLRAAGPVGNVAAGAVGTGMSAGFGAGLMGLMGGLLAFGVGKVVSSAMEKVSQAEDNSVALDRLKRTLGDVNVSFGALKSVVHNGADNLKITYAEAGQLAQQFTKLGNLSGDQYKTLADELGVGVGMSRAFGLDPSQGVGVMGQMRGVGATSNSTESRRFALLIGETIGKAGAFAKADEVMDAIANYATSQTRANTGFANEAAYAGTYSALVGSKAPGMDPQNVAGILARVNASLTAGGAKGEASQFMTGMVGNRLGLDPLQTQIFREGGMFATKRSMFGEGSSYSRYMGGGMAMGGDADVTHFEARMAELKKNPAYANNKLLLAQAAANDTGLSMNQAMNLIDLQPNQMGQMQGYADLGKLSGSGIGNLSKALYGSGDERQDLSRNLLGRDDVSQTDKDALKEAMKGPESVQREVLARLTAQYDQERTQGSDIRDSKNALDNIKVSLADKIAPAINEMRMGIMHLAGFQNGKTSEEVMRDVINNDSQGRTKSINGRFAGEIGPLSERRDYLSNKERSLDPSALAFTYRDRPEVLAQKLKERADVQAELVETDKKIAKLEAERAALLKRENDRRDAEIKKMEKDASERAFSALDPAGPAPGGVPGNQSISRGRAGRGSSARGGRTFTTGGGSSFDGLFEKYGKMYGIDPRLLKAIAMKESTLNPDAVGPENSNGSQDFGLMQHNSKYLNERGLDNGEWKNPERSVEEAAKLLRSNIDRAKSVRGGVRMYNGSGPRAEAYADDVMSRVPSTTVNGGTPLPDVPASSGAAASRSGPLSGEMSLQLDLSPDAKRLLQAPAAPMTGRVGTATPFGGATGSW
jgi:hypothetical protein